MNKFDFNTDIPTLGEAKIISPLKRNTKSGKPVKLFVSDEARIIVDVQMDHQRTNGGKLNSFWESLFSFNRVKTMSEYESLLELYKIFNKSFMVN